MTDIFDHRIMPFPRHRARSCGLSLACAALLAISPLAAANEPYTAGITLERVHIDYEVAPDGTFTRTAETVRRFDTPQGVQQHGQARLAYQGSRGEAEFLAAHVEQPDGRTVTVDHTRVQLQESYPFPEAAIYTDRRHKSLVLPDLRPGSKASVTSRETLRDPTFTGHFSAIEWRSAHFGAHDTRIRFTAPAGMPLFVEAHDAEVMREELDGMVRWTVSMRVEHPWPAEPYGVVPMDYSPRVAVSTFPDYGSFASTYRDMIGDRNAVTPAIQSLADELTQGIDDPREQARVLYEWVAGNVRYVAIHLGRGGWIPHPAHEVLERRYGDCKDHVVLLGALLNAKGIRNSPALIHAGFSWWMPERPTPEAFNHMILRLPDFDLYADSTARYADFGVLPVEVSDKPVLVLADGRLTRTPAVSAGQNRVHVVQRMTLSDNGTIAGETTVRSSGQSAIIDRAGFASASTVADAQLVAQILALSGEHGRGQIGRPTIDALGRDVETSLSYTLTTGLDTASPGRLPVSRGVRFGGIQHFARVLAAETRSSPFLCFASRVEEEQHVSLPGKLRAAALPSGRRIESRDPLLPYTFESSYREADDGGFVIYRKLETSPPGSVCNPSTFPALQALLREIALDYEQSLPYAPR